MAEKEVSLFRDGGKVWTTSVDVARHFGKEHFNVLQAIRNLELEEEYRRLNFQASCYMNEQNKPQPCVHMTRDGFNLVVMGFTGKKATELKVKFIALFNAMEDRLYNIAAQDYNSMQVFIDRANDTAQMLANGLIALGISTVETKKQVERADAKLEQVDKRVLSIEERLNKKRREIKPAVKRQHDCVLERFGNRCPCCHQPCSDPEYDHYHDNQHPDFEHTWPLCKECHSKLTRGIWKRTDVERAFHAYQDFAKRAMPQLPLF